MTDRHNAEVPNQAGFEDDLQSQLDIPTTAEAYRSGIDYFSLNGYRLTPDIAGQFCFHRVFKLSAPIKLKGIHYPKSFKVWTQVASQRAIERFEKVVLEWLQRDPQANQLWLPLIKPDAAKRKPIYAYTQSLVNLKSTQEKQSIEPDNYGVDTFPRICLEDESPAAVAPRAFVPLAEWFPASVRSLTLIDLLSLFPEAERNLLALCIGRAVVGKSGAITPSGVLIKHTSRMAAIILGKDPGLGKSTLFDMLWKALESTGYIVETFSKMGARFNLGSVATADIIYKDDITSSGLKSFVASENTKIIITGNGLLRVEDKGVNAVNVRPCGAIFLNSNEFNPRNVYNIDPGTADRLKMLSTLRKGELDSLEPDSAAYPEIKLEQLSKDLDVHTHTIMLWLARLSADYFWNSIQPLKESKENQLKKEVHYWTHRLRVPLHKNATSQVLGLFLFTHLYEVNHGSKAGRKKFVKMVSSQSTPINAVDWKPKIGRFCAFVADPSSLPFQAFLRWHFETVDPTNEYHPYLGLRILSTKHVAYMETEMAQVLSYPEIISEIMDQLKLSQGLPLSKDYVWLNESWTTILPQTIANLKLAQQMEDVAYVLDEDADLANSVTIKSESIGNHQLALDQYYTPEIQQTISDAWEDAQ